MTDSQNEITKRRPSIASFQTLARVKVEPRRNGFVRQTMQLNPSAWENFDFLPKDTRVAKLGSLLCFGGPPEVEWTGLVMRSGPRKTRVRLTRYFGKSTDTQPGDERSIETMLLGVLKEDSEAANDPWLWGPVASAEKSTSSGETKEEEEEEGKKEVVEVVEEEVEMVEEEVEEEVLEEEQTKKAAFVRHFECHGPQNYDQAFKDRKGCRTSRDKECARIVFVEFGAKPTPRIMIVPQI